MEEVDIAGKMYISSRRAASESGYAQDYIGQLARKGLIEAQRVGGLWYVLLDSVLKYKQQAEAYVPESTNLRPPEPAEPTITVDGKDYASTTYASELTGYNPDYVGQLAREGKIPSQQVGNRWYVDKKALEQHKAEKDALLAAVQAESVGLQFPNTETPSSLKSESDSGAPKSELLSYATETRELMPIIHDDTRKSRQIGELRAEISENQSTSIPIRVITAQAPTYEQVDEVEEFDLGSLVRMYGRSIYIAILSIILLIVLIALYATGVGTSAFNQALHAIGTFMQVSSDALDPMLSVLEGIFSKELVYIRN